MDLSTKQDHSKKEDDHTKSEEKSMNLTVERGAPVTTEGELAASKEGYAPITLKAKLNQYSPYNEIKIITCPKKMYSLHLVVEPKTFLIDPEKGTKYSIRSLSKHKQDVIVEVDSYLFGIKNPRGWYGMKTQVFHRLEPNETMTFEIGMRDLMNIPLDSILGKKISFAGGTISITHYRTYDIKGDSDKDWSVVPGKHQMVQMQVYEDDEFGHWKDALEPQFETEEVKKRKLLLLESNWSFFEKDGPKMIDEKEKKKVTMMTRSVPDDPNENMKKEIKEEKKEAREEAKKWNYNKKSGCVIQ